MTRQIQIHQVMKHALEEMIEIKKVQCCRFCKRMQSKNDSI
jgi:hypothetical protein